MLSMCSTPFMPINITINIYVYICIFFPQKISCWTLTSTPLTSNPATHCARTSSPHETIILGPRAGPRSLSEIPFLLGDFLPGRTQWRVSLTISSAFLSRRLLSSNANLPSHPLNLTALQTKGDWEGSLDQTIQRSQVTLHLYFINITKRGPSSKSSQSTERSLHIVIANASRRGSKLQMSEFF